MHKIVVAGIDERANASSNICAVGCDVIGSVFSRLQHLVELRAREIDVIAIASVAEHHEERNDRYAELLARVRGSMSDVLSVTIAIDKRLGFFRGQMRCDEFGDLADDVVIDFGDRRTDGVFDRAARLARPCVTMQLPRKPKQRCAAVRFVIEFAAQVRAAPGRAAPRRAS